MRKHFEFVFFLLFLLVFPCLAQNKEASLKSADSLFATENYKEALTARNKILSSIKDKNSQEYLVQTYKRYYTEYHLTDNPKDAIQKIDLAISNFKKLKKQPIEENIDLFSEKYHTLAYNGQWEEALAVALESYKICKDKEVKGKSKIDLIYDIGYIYDRLGNVYEAIHFYKISLDLYIKKFGNNSTDVALNYNNLAHVYSRALFHKYSIDYYKKAIQIWEKLPADEANYLITAYQNLIVQLIEYGDLEDAKKITDKLNRQFFKKYKVPSPEPHYLSARQMQVLSNVTMEASLSQFSIAKKTIDSLFNEQVKTKANPETRVVDVVLTGYQSIVDASAFEEKYDLTIEYSKKALLLAQKYKFPRFEMIFHAKLATAFYEKKDFKTALFHIDKAKTVYTFEGFSSSPFSIALIEALIYDGLNNQNQSTKVTKTALDAIILEKAKKVIPLEKVTFKDIDKLTSDRFITVFAKAGKVYLNSYRKTKSIKDLKTAENLYKLSAEMFQEYYLKGSFNAYINTLHLQITEGLLAVLLESHPDSQRTATLINLIERNASQHLVKAFDKKLQASNPERTKLLTQLNQLVAELDYYQKENQLKKKNNSKTKILEQEIKAIQQKIEAKEKNYAQFNVSNFDIKEVQKNITSHQQIVKYYVADEKVYQLMITKNDLKIKEISSVKTLKNKVSGYMNLLKTLNPNYSKQSKQLFAILGKDFSEKQVTIIPDGVLNYLPFETLQTPSGNFLGQEKKLSYDYSLSLWLLHKTKNTEVDSDQVVAFSPFYGQSKEANVRSDFKELRFAKQEVSAIGKLFDADVFMNEKATKSTFINNTKNFGVFHLSMHSLLYDDFNQSCLVFSNNEKLFFSELYNLHIPAKMMVLSACDTGNGKLVNGEGIMSLSRSLSYAGVQSAVVSLWQVPDKETSEIMISFYEFLKKGETKDEALAHAKQEFLKRNPMKSHPFYWAGFVVNGNITPIVSSTNGLLYLGLGIAVVALFYFFRKKLFQFRK